MAQRRAVAPGAPLRSPGPPGGTVPALLPSARPPAILSPATRRGIRQRMLLLRETSARQIAELTGVSRNAVDALHRELQGSGLPDQLISRGAGTAFTQEMPQGALLYLLVRAHRPEHVVETGVRPGYTTAWILAGLDANGTGELTSVGPGSTTGRSAGVHDVAVGQLVPPSLRSRWTLVLGNTEETVARTLEGRNDIDLFLYDNGPDPRRARFELRKAWGALSRRGILLAHRVDVHPAWSEFVAAQGITGPSFLDAGPPPMGALGLRSLGPSR